MPGATVENPGAQNDDVSFFEDTQRQVKQRAFFGSVDFDIIPKVLTVTAGARHYTFDNQFTGSVTYAASTALSRACRRAAATTMPPT